MGTERRHGILAASVLAHLLVLAAVGWHRGIRVEPVHLPGTARGTEMVLTYLPAAAASSQTPAVPRRAPVMHKVVQPRTNALSAPTAPEPVQAAAATPGSSTNASNDALGEGDISIALMQFFPDPRPDLSRLPHGSRGDVVLEAVIDAGGRIAQLTIKQGLGYGVDESVIATVQQWTFHPAMRAGKPVASQQEFHFHYERG